MSNKEEKVVVKPISTAQLTLSAIGFIERFGFAIIVACLQWARIKQKKAEDKLAYIESEQIAKVAKDKLDEQNKGKSDRDIILGFVDGDGTDQSK